MLYVLFHPVVRDSDSSPYENPAQILIPNSEEYTRRFAYNVRKRKGIGEIMYRKFLSSVVLAMVLIASKGGGNLKLCCKE